MPTITTAAINSRAYRDSIVTMPALSSKNKQLAYIEPLPVWLSNLSSTYNGATFLGVDRSGKIQGTALLDATPVVRTLVSLYYRPSGIQLKGAWTDANGAFTFPGLDKTDSGYFVVALDAPYNAQVFDKVVPM